MLIFARRVGVLLLVGLAFWGLAVSQVHAQATPTVAPSSGNLVNPLFRVGPGLTLPQAAYNTKIMGQAYANVPPYALGYNPYPQSGNSGPSIPGLGPYASMYAASPYGAGFTSSPGYGNYGYPSSAYDPYGATNPYTGYSDPYSGYLRGTADVINATGRFLINNQQAQQIREQVRQSKVDTRRRVFDEYLYERANTPSAQDERERLQKLEWRRSLNDPPITEIWSAKALNDLLADAQKLQARGVSGPEIRLDEDLLKRINVSAGSGNGNAGLLKNEGKLHWPLALQTLKPRAESEASRQQINSLIPDAIREATNGKVDAKILRELDRSVKDLQKLLTRNVGELPPGPYMEAKRYLNDLDDAVKILGGRNAGNYFTGKYAAKGKTVAALVKDMTEKGLQFAPAVAGDESAYVALQRALAAYDVSVRSQVASEK